MNILVINCGSSSLKYKLYNFSNQSLVAKGVINHIGEKNSSVKDHNQALKIAYKDLVGKKAIKNSKEIKGVGHRVVHGAEEFKQPCIINKKVVGKIKECIKLAPLHNPVNLAGIKAAQKLFPQAKHVAVFDTAFHQSIPDYAYFYGLPFAYYKKYRVRKYGFHGTSHQFIALKAAEELNKPLKSLKLITCHLGNGCSVSAVDRGKSVDTSMGFTPLEGLIMGTRCGDIDPALVLYLMRKEKLKDLQMDKILNKKSGLLGVSGVSNDYRLIKDAARRGNKRAKLALEMFIYRLKKYIGAYYFIMGGADAIILTAGIGENDKDLARRIKKAVKKIDSKIKVLTIPTDEESMIAHLTYQIIGGKK